MYITAAPTAMERESRIQYQFDMQWNSRSLMGNTFSLFFLLAIFSYRVKNVTNVSQATDTAIPGHGINATYSDGVWYSTVEEIDFDLLSFEAKEGDVIRVTTVGDTEISAVYYIHADYHWGDKMEHVGNGVYEHTVVEDMPIRINVVYSRTATATDGIKVEVVTMNVGEAVQGQTGAVFTGSAGHYLCVITDKDGVEYTTDIVTVSDYYLTKLPAEDDFTVQVNNPEQVESYQWYILEDVVATRPAVPSNPSDDEVEAFYSENVIFHNNKWYATSGNVDYFGFEVSNDLTDTEIVITEISENRDQPMTVGVIADSVDVVTKLELVHSDSVSFGTTPAHSDFVKAVGKLDNTFVLILDLEKIFRAIEEEVSAVQ